MFLWWIFEAKNFVRARSLVNPWNEMNRIEAILTIMQIIIIFHIEPTSKSTLKCPIVWWSSRVGMWELMIRRFNNIEYTALNSHCGRYLHLAFMCFLLWNSNRRWNAYICYALIASLMCWLTYTRFKFSVFRYVFSFSLCSPCCVVFFWVFFSSLVLAKQQMDMSLWTTAIKSFAFFPNFQLFAR